MSHNDEVIICPNCNSEACGNYCSQCGQANHIHKEAFWHLIIHFFGHYFHYDAKFWQTLKILLFQPGKLTVAYWHKQRMRHISPMNLYLFISAVYFLIAFSIPHQGATHAGKIVESVVVDSSGVKKEISIDSLHHIPDSIANSNSVVRYFFNKTEKIARRQHKPAAVYLREKVWYTAPKIMFFMIPVLAWLLKMRFSQRKDLYFVDHAIFAFHGHCFWFSIRLLNLVRINNQVDLVIDILFFVILFIYLSQAIKRAYEVESFNAALTAIGVSCLYAFILAVVTAATMAIYFVLA